ncbi:MAG: hydroxyacylglutathione hydrolase [Syntrophaceae bacterium]|nr:hydroxyacylglutathione hydrolase [Syntrophaceae bacterium]
MLSVEQFRYDADNFSYVIYGKKQAMIIDGGAWREILAFLNNNSLSPEIVTNTHGHYDHTSGNDELRKLTKDQFWDFAAYSDDREIQLEGEKIFVWRTPGHTFDSVCFYTGRSLISGDTLFNGTIGNCFSGDLKSFYFSIKRLMTLPDDTIIYAGHDYVKDSLAFARRLEPDNKNIDKFGKFYDSGHVCSTMADERRINPYLRFNEESIIRLLKKRSLPCATEWERWKSLMSIE